LGVAVTLAFIVILDASSLRKQVGRQASIINKLSQTARPEQQALRERIGHTPIEILTGVLTGAGVAYLVASIWLS
jgi:acid phosphatase family membrane protein YuiD